MNAAELAKILEEDRGHEIRAVMVVHSETSSGLVSDIAAVRKSMDQSEHPALLLVDAVSSLGSIDYRHDEWGVDVTVSGSQKGLRLPPGLSFNAIGKRAVEASRYSTLPKTCASWCSNGSISRWGRAWANSPAAHSASGIWEILMN